MAIIILGKIGLKVLKDYEAQLKEGKTMDTFTFDPKKLGINNADLWYTINERRAKKAKLKETNK
ncbi:MAG: AGCS family alanine or glycine:cation symporter [Clostridium sp.]